MGSSSSGREARVGVQSGKRGPQIVATIINLGPATGTQACATEADGSRVLVQFPLIPAQAGIQRQTQNFPCGPGSPLSRGRAETSPLAAASGFADKTLNQAGEGL